MHYRLPAKLKIALSVFKRHVWLFLALVLLGTGFSWVAVNYETWFGNPDEPAYEAIPEPVRVLLTFGDESEWSRNVSWAAGSTVKESYLELIEQEEKDTLHIPAEGEVFKSRSGVMAFYHAKLISLKPGAHYQYRAVTDNLPSPWYFFTMPEKDRKNYAFLYVGDVQDTLGGSVNAKMRDMVNRNPETEFLLCAGDLVERPIDACWDQMFSSIDSIGQAMPVLNAAGNHDYLKAPIYYLERRFSLVFSYFLDSMVDDNQLYTLNYGDIQFFVLDSTREFLFLPAQRKWLQQKLMSSHAKWKIVVIHHPLLSVQGKNKNLIQKWAFNDLIEKYKVDMVLQGHQHAYARTTKIDEKGIPATPLYVISHCSPKNYLIEFDDSFQKFGSGSQYYQKITVHGDTLGLSARDAVTHELYDSIFIVNRNHQHLLFDRGLQLKEKVDFVGTPASKKEKEFVERIHEYKQKHPNRF